MKSQEKINELNSLTYLNHNAVWCKAALIELDGDKNYWKDEKEITEQFLLNPRDSHLRRRMITSFLGNTLTDHTPESFLFDELVDANWMEASKEVCATITDLLMMKSAETQNLFLKELNEHSPSNPNGPNLSLVDYEKLKEDFFGRLFDLSSVQFFINFTLDEIQQDEAYYPAVIGIDNHKIGIIWYME